MTPPRQKDSPSIVFGLLRHGETEFNREKRVQGHGNSPLTAEGRQNVSSWCELLQSGGWEHILISDLERVQETAALINETLNLPLTVDKRLREQHWGDWEGLLVETVHKEHRDELAIQAPRGWDFCPPRGESRQQVRDRAFAALSDFQRNHPLGKVLVICHLGVIKCLLYSVAGCSFLPDQNIRVEKRSLHHLQFHNDQFDLGEINIPLPTFSP